ncbi:MAG TPA: alpha-ribazole phosphatase [Syntrophomonadaceae bacterium]|nr:alpha-ribazole phosphatase [Syntrophomonadaceae bacterium]
MRMILLRHGQTDWNAWQKYQGQTDIPLNDIGRKQAAEAAHYLKEYEEVQAIYCSDLIRAHETAAIIGQKLGREIIPDRRLREVDFGRWEGMSYSEVYARYPQEFDAWFNNTRRFIIPGGESFQQLQDRVLAAIEDIYQGPHETVLIVTHGGVIKAILDHIDEKTDLWDRAVDTAAMRVVEIDSEGEMKYLAP